MFNHLLTALTWQHLDLVLLIIAYALLLLGYLLQGRDLRDNLHNQAAEIAKLKASYQLQSEQIELLISGYKEIPEHLCDGMPVEQVNDVTSIDSTSCWSSLLKISAGDEHVAGDLAEMLMNELPTIINELDKMSCIQESERETFHQWRGVFRCCGLLELAERFDAKELCLNQSAISLHPKLKEDLVRDPRQLAVETFHAVRNRNPDVRGVADVGNRSRLGSASQIPR